VTGCYAQRAPDEVASLPGVSLVVGNSHKMQLADLAVAGPAHGFVPLAALDAQPQAKDSGRAEIVIGDIFAHTELSAAPVFDGDVAGTGEKTRPNLKIQDGCNNRCSFCIIPFVRGKSRSLKPEAVLDSVRDLVGRGYREVVLSGINLGRWGRDFPAAAAEISAQRLRFADMLRMILAETNRWTGATN
jgi:threonylcarbamoyladenosine tRNA methylthiotransferase MtaB